MFVPIPIPIPILTPLASGERKGTTFSLAIDCRTRGDPYREARVEDKVVVYSPTSSNTPLRRAHTQLETHTRTHTHTHTHTQGRCRYSQRCILHRNEISFTPGIKMKKNVLITGLIKLPINLPKAHVYEIITASVAPPPFLCLSLVPA